MSRTTWQSRARRLRPVAHPCRVLSADMERREDDSDTLTQQLVQRALRIQQCLRAGYEAELRLLTRRPHVRWRRHDHEASALELLRCAPQMRGARHKNDVRDVLGEK